MSPKRPKRVLEPSRTTKVDHLPVVAFAAISSVAYDNLVDFIEFVLESLDRNSNWLNNIVAKQPNFKCVLMTGAGPNRFQVQETIYPTNNRDIKLEVELGESEDHGKIAFAALLKMSNAEMQNLHNYLNTRMSDNPTLRADLVEGRAMGISFAVLTPLSDKLYRVMERLVVANEYLEPCKKRRQLSSA